MNNFAGPMRALETVFSGMSYRQWLISILAIVAYFVLRIGARQLVVNLKGQDREDKRRIVLNLQTVLFISLLLFLFSVWSNEIKTLAFSFFAFAVAVVIATKELILCLSGTFIKSTSKSFHLGERIEINGIRGDVIDRGLLSTTLLEIGPGKQSHQYTGRSVVIPNSMFVSGAVINESFLKDYLLHIFHVPFRIQSDWQRRKEILFEEAQKACAPYIKTAEKYLDELQMRASLQTPSVVPRVHIRFISDEEAEFLVRITVPAREKGRVEQEVLCGYLTRIVTDPNVNLKSAKDD